MAIAERVASYLDAHRLPAVSTGEVVQYQGDLCLHELFERQVAATPDLTAVIDASKTLSYRQLNDDADLLALYLRARGITLDCPVAIHCERSVEYCIAYLAALKAGGCYLPLELAYPKPLLDTVLEDSRAKVTLTKAAYKRNLDGTSTEAFCLDDGWVEQLLAQKEQLEAEVAAMEMKLGGFFPRPTLDSLAYMVYSSGTTGRPKGICCPHRGAVNSYIWRLSYADYGPGDVVGANVFFVWEFLRPLLRGAAVYVISDDVIFDVPNLLAACERQAVSEILFTPTLLETILNTGGSAVKTCLRQLRVVWLCGEVVTVKLRNRFVEALPGVRLLNLYSISECHDVAALDLVSYVPPPSVSTSDFCPVGKIMPAAQALALGEDLQPVKDGELGELFIGGACLAREYLNRPELTASRFIDVPAFDGSGGTLRFYRTGDRARVLPDCGMVEITGRCDFMVKIRGYSVNLGAIEATIVEHTAIKSCAVLAVGEEGEEKMLVAYLVKDKEREFKKNSKNNNFLAEWSMNEKSGSSTQLNTHLQQFLPHYMIPSVYIEIDSLPIQVTTGKIDRAKLPPPPLLRQSNDKDDGTVTPKIDFGGLTAVHCPLIEAVMEAMKILFDETLKLRPGTMGDSDDFFIFGGHSLTATRLLTRVAEVFDVKVTVLELFDAPTPRQLALLVLEKQQELAGRNNVEEDDDFRFNVANDQRHARVRLDLAEEARLDPRVVPSFCPSEELPTLKLASAVFLTGCTGFLGAFLLCELLERTSAKIFCLVRPRNGNRTEAALREVIQKNLESYSLRLSHSERVHPVAGDLSKLRMGLDGETFDELANICDFVVHSGAHVNLVYPYSALKATNVQGTAEVLRFATEGNQRKKVKGVVHVSTNAVLPDYGPSADNEKKVYFEDDELDSYALDVAGGYGQSKWVAERMVWEARNRGLPVVVVRAGNIAGHSVTGAANASDNLFLLVSVCVKSGCFPRVDGWEFEMTPIDFVSSAIVGLGSRPSFFGQAYHLIDPSPVVAERAFHWIEGILGVDVDATDFEEWRKRVKAVIGRLTEAEVSIFSEIERPEHLLSGIRADCSKLSQAANEVGITRVAVNAALFRRYVNYYRSKGWFQL